MGGQYITSAEWARMQRAMGVAGADQWRRKHNISINDEAVSPSDHFGGPQEMALPSDFGMDTGEELPPQSEDEYADAGNAMLGVPLAVRPPQADEQSDQEEAAPSLSARPSTSLAAKGESLLDGSRRNIAALYEDAAAKLKDLYHAPSTGEMLVAMGAQLMRPTGSGSFGEALGNALSVVPQFMQSKREYRNDYAKQLALLQRSYLGDMGTLEGRYITAASKAPPQRRVASDSVTGARYRTDTGADVPSPERVAFLLQNKNDPMVRQVFDTQYGQGEADYYINGGR